MAPRSFFPVALPGAANFATAPPGVAFDAWPPERGESVAGGHGRTERRARGACPDRTRRCPRTFEDNAEFGLGMRLPLDAQSDHARQLLTRLAPAARRRRPPLAVLWRSSRPPAKPPERRTSAPSPAPTATSTSHRSRWGPT